MLHRSASSRRRRASRSAATSPQSRPSRSATSSPGRRASITTSPVDDLDERASFNILTLDMSRAHRLDFPPLQSEYICLTDNITLHKPRMEEFSPRNSLVPDTLSSRSPRNSLVPVDVHMKSPRNSLIPDNYNRSPRNSVIPEIGRSPRNSLVPESYRTSPRQSVAYDTRSNLVPEYNRSPRTSLIPDMNRPPKTNYNQPLQDEELTSRSPRHSITPESNRSPRGSIGQENPPKRCSPRGSVASEYYDRSPRSSVAVVEITNKSPRGSIIRSSNTEESGRSRRSSVALTFQEPRAVERKHSGGDNTSEKGRSNISPYRSPSRGAITTGSSTVTISESGSRRASSNSQVSDEQRRLCSEQKSADGEQSLGFRLSLTTYGSVVYQLKDANLEASGTCDFICKALDIVNKTVVVTVVLVCLSTLPVLMLIMGVQFLRDCPREPYIPIYMVVGGTLGCVEMAWILWNQLYTRRLEISTMNASSIASKVAFFALTAFLIVWFAMGNYWILRIKWPEYTPTLFEPNRWCHRTLYLFSYIHLFIVHTTFGAIVLLVLTLAGCQIFGCPWLGAGVFK